MKDILGEAESVSVTLDYGQNAKRKDVWALYVILLEIGPYTH